MKTAAFSIAGLMIATSLAQGQLPLWTLKLNQEQSGTLQRQAPNPTATGSIQAKGISAGALTTDNWRTDWGSYNRDYERQHHVEVNLATWGSGERNAEIEAIWFGRSLSDNRRVVLKRDARPFALRGGTLRQSILFSSGVVFGNVTKYASLGERYGRGWKIEGWYVRLVIDGRNVSDASSASHLANIARDTQRMAALPHLERR